MSEKCPKCGAKYVFGEALMRSFECETQTVAGDLYHESELCKARQTIALKDKEIAELREGLRPFAAMTKSFIEAYPDTKILLERYHEAHPNPVEWLTIILGDLRRASTLLKGEKEGEGK